MRKNREGDKGRGGLLDRSSVTEERRSNSANAYRQPSKSEEQDRGEEGSPRNSSVAHNERWKRERKSSRLIASQRKAIAVANVESRGGETTLDDEKKGRGHLFDSR